MRSFFKQNADLIVTNDALRPFFQDQLEGRRISDDAYIKFAEAVGRRLVGPCNFIVDEAQKLLHASEKSEESFKLGKVPSEDKRFFEEVVDDIRS